MKQAEKNMKRRFTNLPRSIVWVLKIGIAVAGFALLGWWFVAVVVGVDIAVAVVKTLLSCLVSLLCLAVVITLIIALIF